MICCLRYQNLLPALSVPAKRAQTSGKHTNLSPPDVRTRTAAPICGRAIAVSYDERATWPSTSLRCRPERKGRATRLRGYDANDARPSVCQGRKRGTQSRSSAIIRKRQRIASFLRIKISDKHSENYIQTKDDINQTQSRWRYFGRHRLKLKPHSSWGAEPGLAD